MGERGAADAGERRYYGLDALRGVMMMLGIVLHAAQMYLAAPPPTIPFPFDRNSSLLFDLLFHFIHQFRMPTFFVLAGFFCALLVEKRGLWETYKNRAARVAAPLAVACLTILPVTLILFLDMALNVLYGVRELLPDPGLMARMDRELAAKGHVTGLLPAFHLWFLIYLLYFYLLLPLCGWLAQRLRRHEAAVANWLGAPALMIPLGLCTALTLWPYRGAQVLEGFIFFRPHAPSLAYYGAFFVFGYLIRSFPAFFQTAARHVWGYALLAAALFPIALYASHLLYAAGKSPGAELHLAAVLANGMCTWALIYFFVGCALRYFDHAANWILYASQSSYWVFLVHMPIVMIASWWLLPYDLPALLKFTLVVAFTATLCFVSHHFLVQRTWISVFLNGRRFNLPWAWR